MICNSLIPYLTAGALTCAITAVAIRFGNCNNDLIDGVGALNLNNAATNANWNIGASVFLSVLEQ